MSILAYKLAQLGAGFGVGTDEFSRHANAAAFPAVGESDTLYLDDSTLTLYAWSGGAYMSLNVRTQTDASGATVLSAGGVRPDMPAIPKYRAMVFGNSIANQSKVATDVGSYYHTLSAVRGFNALMQGAFVFDDTGDSTIGGQALTQGVWGYSGGTSSQTVPHLADALAAYSPGVVFLHLFENDITSLTLAESYANLKAAVVACKNAGAIPIVFTCLPSLSFTTTAHRDYFAQINDLIFEYCNSIEGAIPVDVSAYINTAAVYPQPLSTYTDASVHPTQKGNSLLANWIYDQISGLFQRRIHRVRGKTGGNELLSVIPNPSMSGSAGANSTGSSGTVADSWTVSASGTGHAVVASKIADGTKESQKLSSTFADAGGWLSASVISCFGANVTTGFSVGDKVCFEIEAEVTGTPVAFKTVYGDLLVGGASEHAYTEGFLGSAASGALGVVPSGRFVLRSPIYTIPGTATGLRPFIIAKYETGVTSASCDLIIHSAVVRKVPFAQS